MKLGGDELADESTFEEAGVEDGATLVATVDEQVRRRSTRVWCCIILLLAWRWLASCGADN